CGISAMTAPRVAQQPRSSLASCCLSTSGRAIRRLLRTCRLFPSLGPILPTRAAPKREATAGSSSAATRRKSRRKRASTLCSSSRRGAKRRARRCTSLPKSSPATVSCSPLVNPCYREPRRKAAEAMGRRPAGQEAVTEQADPPGGPALPPLWRLTRLQNAGAAAPPLRMHLFRFLLSLGEVDP